VPDYGTVAKKLEKISNVAYTRIHSIIKREGMVMSNIQKEKIMAWKTIDENSTLKFDFDVNARIAELEHYDTNKLEKEFGFSSQNQSEKIRSTTPLLSGVVKLHFGTAYYFNTVDREGVERALIIAGRLAGMHEHGFRGVSTSCVPNTTISTQEQLKNGLVGLFFIIDEKIYTKPFPIGTSEANFSWHKDFFPTLGVDGEYDSYPRGYTIWKPETNLYAVVGGDYLNKELAEKICKTFKIDSESCSWTYFDIYLYRIQL
jgi:hypothetical protein